MVKRAEIDVGRRSEAKDKAAAAAVAAALKNLPDLVETRVHLGREHVDLRQV